MLVEKLGDTKHKSLYMKIAKNEEQELIMDALHYVTAGNLSGNLGAIFMWKLKELKQRPLLPLALRLECTEGYFKVGSITGAIRGDMPLLSAILNDYNESCAQELSFSDLPKKSDSTLDIASVPFVSLIPLLGNTLKEFDRSVRLSLFKSWSWHASNGNVMPVGQVVGKLKVSAPQLAKREYEKKYYAKKAFGYR